MDLQYVSVLSVFSLFVDCLQFSYVIPIGDCLMGDGPQSICGRIASRNEEAARIGSSWLLDLDGSDQV